MPASIGQPPGIVAVILFPAFFAQALKEIGIPFPGLTQSLLVYAGYQFSGAGFFFGIGIVLCCGWAIYHGFDGAHLDCRR